MSNIALIKNNKVENIIVADIEFARSLPGYDYVFELTDNGINIGFVNINGSWLNPDLQESPETSLSQILTPLEFINRFTNDEAKTILSLSKTNINVELWWVKYNKAQFIDLGDPLTIEGVNLLESIGIIAPGRATEILTENN